MCGPVTLKRVFGAAMIGFYLVLGFRFVSSLVFAAILTSIFDTHAKVAFPAAPAGDAYGLYAKQLTTSARERVGRFFDNGLATVVSIPASVASRLAQATATTPTDTTARTASGAAQAGRPSAAGAAPQAAAVPVRVEGQETVEGTGANNPIDLGESLLYVIPVSRGTTADNITITWREEDSPNARTELVVTVTTTQRGSWHQDLKLPFSIGPEAVSARVEPADGTLAVTVAKPRVVEANIPVHQG